MNNQSVEKKELIQNTQEFNTQIQRLADDNEKLSYLDFSIIKEKLEKNHKLLAKLEKDECEIAIVGLEKAGKSTFANALIGSDIFPSAAERCTYTTTRLIYGEDKAVVTFYTKPEFNSRFMRLLELVKYPSITEETFDVLSTQEFNKYFASLEYNQPELYNSHKGKAEIEIQDILNNKNKMTLTGEAIIFNGSEITSDLFKSYIKGENNDKSKPYSVKSIEIQSSKLNQLKNAIIFDVPGFDSTTQLHTEQTVERLKSADIIILITNVGQNPNIQGTILNILKEQADYDGVKLKEKLFIFGNKKDSANSLEQAEENHHTLLNDAIKLELGNDKNVFSGSALKYLYDNKITQETYKNNFKTNDNIDLFRKAIVAYYQNERLELLKGKIKRNKESILRDLNSLFNKYQSDIYSLSSSPEGARDNLIAKSNAELNSKFKDAIRKIRINFKSDIIGSDNKENKFLTLQLQTRFDEKCNFPKVNEQNLNEVIVDIDNSASTEFNNESANTQLRRKTSPKIRQSISDIIQEFFEEQANDKEQDILTQLLLSISPTQNKEVKEVLTQFIHNVRTENIYNHEKYEYLFERFARNLFDIFNYSLGSEARKNKFNNAKKDFIYLDSYYCDEKTDDFKLITLLLTQKSEDKNLLIKTLEKIYQAVDDWIKNDKLHLEKAQKTIEIVSDLWKWTKKLSDKNTSEEKSIDNKLEKSKKLFDLVNADDIAESVKASNSKEEIISEINTDIANIKDIIRNAVIKAMNIEIVFFNSIDKQLSLLQDSANIDNNQYYQYQNLINKIIHIEYAKELANIAEIVASNQKKKELLEEIKNLLSI